MYKISIDTRSYYGAFHLLRNNQTINRPLTSHYKFLVPGMTYGQLI